ncbi:MAG: AAA family ATPase [Bryobacterales bacterium]|nr:AAA family ATPase [Gammaproteobacteria bacterium]MDE0435515.1 AAA family ATPase [Bryobacterales bacterium]
MTAPKMAMSADFLAAFAKLPSQQQRAVRTMISRFDQDSRGTGLNYERIANAKDANMRSLRIDGNYRAIVLKPEKGDIHMLLWADKHDDAYDWATRHVCTINEETGALQVYQPRLVADQSVDDDATGSLEQEQQGDSGDSVFGDLKLRELVRLGVPAEMVGEVLDISTEDALEDLAPRLPGEAYDSLFLYMAGDSYEDIVLEREAPQKAVDTADFEAALGRDDSRARFVVIEDDLELEEMFNAPLERWRVFLHPSQRRLVERHWNGPVRVLGGAGTGKTVVAMHRARWLAKELEPGQRILFTTFTRNLAADIRNNLRAICSAEEMERIEVTNLDQWVHGFLRGKRYRFRLSFGRDREAWREALTEKPSDSTFSNAFYSDEWEQVIQANGITAREEYLRVRRTSRGTRLNRATRAAIWGVFEEYRAQLAERGIMEVADCYRAATALVEDDRTGANFAAVIVDEAQDMIAPAWRLLRAIAPEGQNDLFIVGDAHQRIYSRHRVVLGQLGIEIRGRARKLRLNYRTTEETRRWAATLLQGRSIDDLDGGSDDNTRIRSAANGPEPRLEHFADREGQSNWIIRYLTDLEDRHEPLRGVCVVARTREERDAIAEELEDAELQVEVLEADSPDEASVGVRLATMHRVKGLEFDHMVIASVNKGIVPLPAAAYSVDWPERSAAETGERALLYVAATRAKKELAVLSFGDPSPLLS